MSVHPETSSLLDHLIRGECWDPFSVLGPHVQGSSSGLETIVRVFLPEAAAAMVVPVESHGQAVPMTYGHLLPEWIIGAAEQEANQRNPGEFFKRVAGGRPWSTGS